MQSEPSLEQKAKQYKKTRNADIFGDDDITVIPKKSPAETSRKPAPAA